MRKRLGDWIATYRGIAFWPLDSRPADVDIRDIAHALALKCRYGGHCDRHYSVAEHSVLIARYLRKLGLPTLIVLWGLLHDATEAFLPDVPRPIKVLPEFEWLRIIEHEIMCVICERFGLPPDEPPEVIAADHAILRDESALLKRAVKIWTTLPEKGIGVRVQGWPWQRAEHEFLTLFYELNRPTKVNVSVAGLETEIAERIFFMGNRGVSYLEIANRLGLSVHVVRRSYQRTLREVNRALAS